MIYDPMATVLEGTDVPSAVDTLLSHLYSDDGATRKQAREILVKIGKSVVPKLIPLVSHPEEHVRWEACKTLEKIRDPRAAKALAAALLDDDMDVRWVAADAIIELEREAIEPVLEMIEEHFDSVLLREAAHHVLYSLMQAKLLDEKSEVVMHALTNFELPTKAAFAAIIALDYLRSGREHRKKMALVF